MKKAEEELSKSTHRMKAYSKARADALHSELEAILAHPQAEGIFLNEWLHDAGLPVPSADLLDYISNDLLYNPGKYQRYYNAEAKDAIDTIRNYVLELKQTPSAALRESVELALKRGKLLSFAASNKGGSGKNAFGWWLALWSFWGCSGENQLFPAGERRLAQHMLQSMVLRAVFHGDATRLEGLAEAVRADKSQSAFNPTQAGILAFQMFRWMPYLAEKLGRAPQKSEMQFFLLNIYRDISDSPKDWAAASKQINFPVKERGRRADTSPLLKIAREVDTTKEPQVKRKPAWKPPLPPTAREDLPK